MDIHSWQARSYPALTGDVVTQGHADYCATYGHATHTCDGVDTGICPRCGDVTVALMSTAPARQLPSIAAAHSEQVLRDRIRDHAGHTRMCGTHEGHVCDCGAETVTR